MRALLVNPWIHDFAAYDLWSKPLGLIKIASHLRRLGFETNLLDCLDRYHPLMSVYRVKETDYGDGQYYFENIPKPNCFKDIPRNFKRYGMPVDIFGEILSKEKEPDVILIGSSLTYWYPGAFEVIKLVKERLKKTPVILGGIYATLCSRHARKFSQADIVVDDNGMDDILKVILRAAGKNKISINKKDIRDFDLYAYDLYPRLKYITLRTSNGCPFHCSYCGWHRINPRFVQYNHKDIVKFVSYFNRNYSIRDFAFYDEALLYNAKNHFMKLFESIIGHKIHCNFHVPSGLHCKFITKDIAKLMRDANFIHPRLGLETIEVGLLKKTGGKLTLRDFNKAINHLIKAGYKSSDIEVNILAGLPGQKFDQVNEAIGFVSKLGTRIHLEEFSPIPYTRDFAKSGLSVSDDPLLQNNTVFVLKHPEFGKRLQFLKDKARGINRSLVATHR